MPYRRLPKTDQARLHALKQAVHHAEEVEFNQQAINYKTLIEAQRLLLQFENQVAQYHANFDSKVLDNKQYRHKVRNARMYISHFIQVLNLAAIRGEIKKSQKELYKLDPNNHTLPDLSTEENLITWGQNIIDGENARTSQGGFPIYNPAINKVKVHYDIFREHYNAHTMHQRSHSRVFGEIERKLWRYLLYPKPFSSSIMGRQRIIHRYRFCKAVEPCERGLYNSANSTFAYALNLNSSIFFLLFCFYKFTK